MSEDNLEIVDLDSLDSGKQEEQALNETEAVEAEKAQGERTGGKNGRSGPSWLVLCWLSGQCFSYYTG